MKNVYVHIRISPDQFGQGSMIEGIFSGDKFTGKIYRGSGYRVGSRIEENDPSCTIWSAKEAIAAVAASRAYACMACEGIDPSLDGSRGFIAAYCK
jgi:hypothetical protein